MADSNSTDAFDVFTQVFTLLGPDGVTEIPVAVDEVDSVYTSMFAASVNYGSQIGASIIMLIVYLLMTPQTKFRRVPTVINILALLFNVVRCVLLSWFPSSQWFEFYVLWSGDLSSVPASDYRTSVAGTVATVPTIVLIEAALIVQAWAMIQLWPAASKIPTIGFSALIATAAVGFKVASSILQAIAIVHPVRLVFWVRKTDLAFSSASIFWFCLIFNIRLATHMWKNRSILPNVKGISAMEVLVMTNGVLMLVPTFFAGLQFGRWPGFEFGSLTYTSVVVVLPLGTLAAQRIANPSAFSSPDGSNSRGSGGGGGGNRRVPFLKSWHSTTDNASNGVSSRVESERQNSVQEAELARYGSADLEKGVRVARQIEHHEQRAL